jgi:hypothetical protein
VSVPSLPADESRTRLEQALAWLLRRSVTLRPDDVGDAAREAGQLLGGRDVELLVVDIGQRTLGPILPFGEALPAGLRVDSTVAGQAYRTESVLVEPRDSGVRLWAPVMDSAERVGLLGATLDEVDDRALDDWSLLGSLLGELVVTKARYGDAVTNSRRTGPVSVAAELRWALLPPLTFTSEDVVVSGILEPAHDIAGDTFDYAVNGRVLRAAVFDAMGHGLNASRLANLAVGVHRNSRRAGLDLVADVQAMDRTIQEQIGGSQFVTAQLVELNLDTGVIQAVSAGHPPAVVLRADGSDEPLASARCRPLGLDAEPDTPPATQLRPGDVVLVHTDGVDEARSPSGEFFGVERLHRLVRALLEEGHRPAEVLRQVGAQLLEHRQDLVDDASLMILVWRPGPRAVAPAERTSTGPADGPLQ